MKYKATLVVENPIYYNNYRFSKDIRDNLNAYDITLKEELKKHDIDLATEDINKIEEADIVIYNSAPGARTAKKHNQKKYLLIVEPPVVLPANWNKKNHEGFDRIFTWDESLVDNKKYFLLRFGYRFRYDPGDIKSNDRQLCTMISGFKYFYLHPDELYSERYKAVKWFTKYHPENFKYYGKGWPNYLFRPHLNKFFCRAPQWILKLFLLENISYGGVLESKHSTLQKFRFSICYENMRGIPGYVTEKIFDSFSAGCIPIYWGASNIEKLIPEDCYIDRRKFESYEELYKHICSLNERTLAQILNNISDYLSSGRANMFKASTYAQTLTSYILKDIKK
ncbi:hypothetical protein A2303_04715 [Candidatus Falkowbacteria bacterium RIFOXYB2_FULL_47_14]|uniref:Fucosyltransferase C-terminal domain-containing protein n=1 Tax=Candidatus Falkowbacteria bacterium RIFOXYA2_FULL_47_19 TaxID=1797994 RepID=A0A1F5SHD5_9BACT|nr:MAG: hypothetical protein A2227_02550 [Candidatus Falkowbacteria bacterium RIFOXYA2_FULL_47_19]OGF35804.1 MAG: hypothetical protein A2468_03735 [Candidatus Falkowbacteria bacterium RIFOXYC2_FULL_46_15]OGF42677.1 MAG: hypothetical protein A2303_04715 [Candidatus Falkowbacteria bacterium RIFOXYB2_FULL_47_14]